MTKIKLAIISLKNSNPMIVPLCRFRMFRSLLWAVMYSLRRCTQKVYKSKLYTLSNSVYGTFAQKELHMATSPQSEVQDFKDGIFCATLKVCETCLHFGLSAVVYERCHIHLHKILYINYTNKMYTTTYKPFTWHHMNAQRKVCVGLFFFRTQLQKL